MRLSVLSPFVAVAYLMFSAGCDRGPSAQEHFDKALTFKQSGDWRASIIELKSALQSNPDYTDARWELGQAYLKLGSGLEAEKELNRAKNLGYKRPELTLALGRSLLLQQKNRHLTRIEKKSGAPRAIAVRMYSGTHSTSGQRSTFGKESRSTLRLATKGVA